MSPPLHLARAPRTEHAGRGSSFPAHGDWIKGRPAGSLVPAGHPAANAGNVVRGRGLPADRLPRPGADRLRSPGCRSGRGRPREGGPSRCRRVGSVTGTSPRRRAACSPSAARCLAGTGRWLMRRRSVRRRSMLSANAASARSALSVSAGSVELGRISMVGGDRRPRDQAAEARALHLIGDLVGRLLVQLPSEPIAYTPRSRWSWSRSTQTCVTSKPGGATRPRTAGSGLN